jgi:hypothetical protein
MRTIEVIGRVDEQHCLQADLPLDVPPGPVKVIVELGPQSEEAGEWARAVSQSWAADWHDPCEDVYTLQDGEP